MFASLNSINFIEKFVNILLPILGFGALFWQIDRQHKNNIKLQNDVLSNQIKKEIFDSLIEEIDLLSKLVIRHYNDCSRVLKPSFTNGKAEYQADDELIKNFHNDHADILDQMLLIAKVLEDREIIEPKLSIFRKFVNVFQHDYHKAFDNVQAILFQYYGKSYDVDTYATVKVLEELQPYQRQVFKALDLVYDLKVELQNICFKNIFGGNQVSLREPLDPGVKVITTQNFDDLDIYFENETEWGKQKQEIFEEQKYKFNQEQP